MNPKFSWNRFCKVVAKDGRSLWSNYGLTMLIISMLPFAFWLFKFVLSVMTHNISETDPDLRRSFYFFALPLLVAIMAPSRMYRTCNLPKEGVYFAMLPASKLEKYLSMMLYCVIVCPLLSFLAILLMDTLLSVLPFGSYMQGWWVDNATVSMGDDVPGYIVWGVGILIFLLYFKKVMLFMFTSTIFKRHKVIKTVLWLMAIYFVLSLIMMPLLVVIGNSYSESIETFFGSYRVDYELLGGYVLWSAVAVQFVVSAVLVWWTGHRLKKMRY